MSKLSNTLRETVGKSMTERVHRLLDEAHYRATEMHFDNSPVMQHEFAVELYQSLALLFGTPVMPNQPNDMNKSDFQMLQSAANMNSIVGMVKAIRAMFGMGLFEAKTCVERAYSQKTGEFFVDQWVVCGVILGEKAEKGNELISRWNWNRELERTPIVNGKLVEPVPPVKPFDPFAFNAFSELKKGAEEKEHITMIRGLRGMFQCGLKEANDEIHRVYSNGHFIEKHWNFMGKNIGDFKNGKWVWCYQQ